MKKCRHSAGGAARCFTFMFLVSLVHGDDLSPQMEKALHCEACKSVAMAAQLVLEDVHTTIKYPTLKPTDKMREMRLKIYYVRRGDLIKSPIPSKQFISHVVSALVV